MPRLLLQPHGERLGDLLNRRLQDPGWTTFRSAVAFVKHSGVIHVAGNLQTFARRGRVKMAVGVSMRGTSVEGLESLLECLDGHGEVWVFHNENGPTFHPKMYVFSNDTNAEVIVGSGNLTRGGLFDNYEASIAFTLDLTDAEDRALLTEVEAILDAYTNPVPGTAVALSHETLERLRAAGYVVPEAHMRHAEREPVTATREGVATSTVTRLFRHAEVPPPPAPAAVRAAAPGRVEKTPPAFYMTLQRTDVSAGQVTSGTARRSPELFIPLAARDAAPEFWRWPAAFRHDPRRPGKMDRIDVPMLIGNSVAGVNMMTWPDKHDFRLRSEMLRSAGTVGDVLRIEKTDGAPEHDYSVTVIRPGDPDYEQAAARCANAVRNSEKRWGYE